MYSFVRALPEVKEGGSWRASVKTWNPAGPGYTGYSHGRQSDVILADSGWHCSWCFKYIEDFQFKMRSYSHYDRVTRPEKQLEPAEIQHKICEGKDVFDMYPVSFEHDSSLQHCLTKVLTSCRVGGIFIRQLVPLIRHIPLDTFIHAATMVGSPECGPVRLSPTARQMWA